MKKTLIAFALLTGLVACKKEETIIPTQKPTHVVTDSLIKDSLIKDTSSFDVYFMWSPNVGLERTSAIIVNTDTLIVPAVTGETFADDFVFVNILPFLDSRNIKYINNSSAERAHLVIYAKSVIAYNYISAYKR